MNITAHPLPGRPTRHDIERIQSAIDTAPTYSGKVKNALAHVIKVIHGLPHLHTGLEAKEIEIYIGKAERTTDAVLARWMKHRTDHKKHLFGIILFKCSLDNAKKLEKVAINVVKKLKKHRRLCVGEANISPASGGRNPQSQDAVIYMTWCPLQNQSAYTKPTVAIIAQVAREVGPIVRGLVTEAQIRGGLEAIKRPTTFKNLRLDYYC